MTFGIGDRSKLSLAKRNRHLQVTNNDFSIVASAMQGSDLEDIAVSTLNEELKTQEKPNKHKLHVLLQAEYKSGTNKESAFKKMCPENGLDVPPSETVSKWFKSFESLSDNLKRDIGDEYYELLELVARKYEILSKATCFCSFPNDNAFLPNDSQFVYGFQKSGQKSLVVVNCKSGTRSNIPINFNKFTPPNFNSLNQVKIYPLDFNYAILAINDYSNPNVPSLQLYALEIDHNSNKCKVLSQKQLEMSLDLQSIVFDQVDKQKFVLIGKESSNEKNYAAIEGQLNNKSISVNESIVKSLPQTFECHSLCNSKLFGIFYEKDKMENLSYGYWECLLNNINGKSDVVKKFKFNIEFDKDEAMVPDSSIYTWSKDTCYTAVFCSHGLWNVYIFNLTTKKCSVLNVGYHTIFDLNIDQSKMLSILSNDAVYKVSAAVNIEEKKKLKKKEQNRVAAEKFRHKTKKQIEDLTNEVEEKKQQVKQMSVILMNAQKELEMMRKIFNEHQQTSCSLMNNMVNFYNTQQ